MLKCRCGGEYKNADTIFDCGVRNQGHVVYDVKRIYPGFATRRCNACGKLRKQKLRVAKEKHASQTTQSVS